MTTKHTPGPWTCTPGLRNDAEYCVYDKDGDFLTDGDLEHEANARLIAAAPDLLEALEETKNQLATNAGYYHRAGFKISNERTNMTSAAILMADRAIAKARGE